MLPCIEVQVLSFTELICFKQFMKGTTKNLWKQEEMRRGEYLLWGICRFIFAQLVVLSSLCSLLHRKAPIREGSESQQTPNRQPEPWLQLISQYREDDWTKQLAAVCMSKSNENKNDKYDDGKFRIRNQGLEVLQHFAGLLFCVL